MGERRGLENDLALPRPSPFGAVPSDQEAWDSVALSELYEITGEANLRQYAVNAYNDLDAPGFFRGACPEIPYQSPTIGNHLKTLETDSNLIAAAIRLYLSSGPTDPARAGYLQDAVAHYARAKKWYYDAGHSLYSVWVVDNGQTCLPIPGRFYASVNGLMIGNAALLYKLTGTGSYLNDALANFVGLSALNDSSGIFTNLQADNDVGVPLLLGLYLLTTAEPNPQVTTWVSKNFGAAALGYNAVDRLYDRFFNSPPLAGVHCSNIWQAGGGSVLALLAGSTNPGGVVGAADPWAHATLSQVDLLLSEQPGHSKNLDANGNITISFKGSGISLLGPFPETDLGGSLGHCRVFLDGVETTDQSGIWQGRIATVSGCVDPAKNLFTWRWSTAGQHTLTLEPAIADVKEGGTYAHITGYLISP